MGCEYLLRRPDGHLRKDRAAAGQTHTGRPRQMKCVISIKEQYEHLGAADHAHGRTWIAERTQGLIECRAGRVPQQRPVVRPVRRDGGDLPRQDQPVALMRACQVILRVAPVHDDVDGVQSLFEEALIGIELQRVRA